MIIVPSNVSAIPKVKPTIKGTTYTTGTATYPTYAVGDMLIGYTAYVSNLSSSTPGASFTSSGVTQPTWTTIAAANGQWVGYTIVTRTDYIAPGLSGATNAKCIISLSGANSIGVSSMGYFGNNLSIYAPAITPDPSGTSVVIHFASAASDIQSYTNPSGYTYLTTASATITAIASKNVTTTAPLVYLANQFSNTTMGGASIEIQP